MNKVKISAKTVCYSTERGHYGFGYPSVKFSTSNNDIIGERLGWIEFNGLIPIKISEDDKIKNEFLTSIVWIERFDLKNIT